jgi:hypothetical protein
VLVVVYEAEGDARETGTQGQTFAGEYLWSRIPAENVPQQEGIGGEEVNGVGEEGQFTIEDSDPEDEDENEIEAGARAFKATVGRPMVPQSEQATKVNGGSQVIDPLTAAANGAAEKEEEERQEMLPSLVDRLFSCTIDLLFCAGFTVPENLRGRDNQLDKINVSVIHGRR